MAMNWLGRRGRPIRFWANDFSNFRAVLDSDCDAHIKDAVLKVSSTVVSITSHTGDDVFFIGSGTMIEYDEQQGYATILTSATLVRGPDSATSIPSDLKIEVRLYDGRLYEGQLATCNFHYNIAIIKIKSTTALSIATIRYVDDSVALDSRKIASVERSTHFLLLPEERVIALGRDYKDNYGIMASLGVFSIHDCRHDFKELFLTSCVVTKLAIGGPLINCHGEVIGINFFICPYNVFVPINIVAKCLEDMKRNGQAARPWLGVQIGNLYSATLEKLNKLNREFPDISAGGVIIEHVIGNGSLRFRKSTKAHHWTALSVRNRFKVKAIHEHNRRRERMKSVIAKKDRIKVKVKEWQRSSPASVAGLRAGDVIIKCGDVSVDSHLKFVEALWDKEGKHLELILLRPGSGQLTVSLTVGTSPEMPRWYV